MPVCRRTSLLSSTQVCRRASHFVFINVADNFQILLLPVAHYLKFQKYRIRNKPPFVVSVLNMALLVYTVWNAAGQPPPPPEKKIRTKTLATHSV